MSLANRLKSLVRDVGDRAAVRVGLSHSEERLAGDAGAYWTGAAGGQAWRNDSHFRDGSVFADVSWAAVGAEHWRLFERLARVCEPAAGSGRRLDRMVEWGCGGGSNAVAFAPQCEVEFVGVDITPESVEECRRQVAEVTGTNFSGVVVDVADPEAALSRIEPCDLFLCVYVLELVPSPAYGLRVMDCAQRLLRPGGLAFVQVKYDTGRWNTGSRRRSYRGSTAASMTSYRIDEFWSAMAARGLQPEACYLVPENELDQRYAYYLLRKV